MRRLFLVRHAHAISRRQWGDPDRDRPLSPRGKAQAEDICLYLAEKKPVRVVSSPSLRCVDTVAPLASELRLPVETDDRLLEAGPADELDQPDVALRLAGRADAVITEIVSDEGPVVVCSHGDVIPSWLEMVAARDGVKIKGGNAKGSIWQLDFDRDRCVGARYRKGARASLP